MDLSGRYEMVSSEGYDGYLNAVGVGQLTRKLANSAKPTVEISVEGDEWCIRTITTFKTMELKFSLDREFVEETEDGRKVKTTYSLDGDRLSSVQKLDGLEARISREFTASGMTMNCEANGVVATRVFKRL